MRKHSPAMHPPCLALKASEVSPMRQGQSEYAQPVMLELCPIMPSYAELCRVMPSYAQLCPVCPVCRVMPSYAQLCPVMPRYGQYAQYAMLCPVMPSYADGFPKDAPGISDLPIVPKVMPAYSGWPYHAPRQDEQRQQRHVRSRQVPAQPRQPHRALLPAQPPPCRAHSITRV
jgi:hypothetical protein